MCWNLQVLSSEFVLQNMNMNDPHIMSDVEETLTFHLTKQSDNLITDPSQGYFSIIDILIIILILFRNRFFK